MNAAKEPAAAGLSIAVGRTYRAKKPANCGGYINDRQVLWSNGEVVQYDGPAVANGRKYPKVTMDDFKAWAGKDVTDSLPKGEWAPFPRRGTP